MSEMTYDEVFRMISLLKGEFRNVKEDTKPLKNEPTVSPQEKMDKLIKIEDQCIQNTSKYPDIDKGFLLDIHQLLLNNNEAYRGDSYYLDFLRKYTDERLQDILSFIKSELLGEYQHAIRKPKQIIGLGLNKKVEDDHM